MNINKEIRSLRNEMRYYKLVKANQDDLRGGEDLIKEKMTITPVKIYQDIGKKKLSFRTESQIISNKAANFLNFILIEEKEKYKGKKEIDPQNHLRIRDIHNYFSVRTNFKVMLFTFGFPLLFFFRISKLKSYYRYIFFIPSLISIGPIFEGVKNYVTSQNAFLMLICIEKYYRDEKDVYNRYKEFMHQNNLELLKKKI